LIAEPGVTSLSNLLSLALFYVSLLFAVDMMF